MFDLNESRKKLLAVLDKEKKDKYFQLLHSWWLFKNPLSVIQFNAAVSKILQTKEELKAHNQFMFAAMAVRNMNYLHNHARTSITEYIETPAQNNHSLPNYIGRTAVSEFFFPDIGFIANRIDLLAWENGLDGSDKHVPEYVANLCQTFIKNILTAMISNKKSYKIRDRHFQYGFGIPAANPLLRNSNNIIDRTQESKVDLTEDEDSFLPTFKPSIETIEQETAFSYACGNRSYTGEKLTVKLLYDTLHDNPHIVGLHSIHSTNLLKLGLQFDDL